MSDDVYSRVRKTGLKLKGSRRCRKDEKQAKERCEESKGDEIVEPTVEDCKSPEIESQELGSQEAESNTAMDVVDADIKKLAAMEGLTSSERAHRLHLLHKRRDKIARELKRTHREKMEEFNKKLNSLSEHFDVPKVGPG